MDTFIKDPDAVIDYSIDWTKWLSGDVINASSFIIAGDDSSLIVPTSGVTTPRSFDDTMATIWLKGGTNGNNYTITNRISTVGQRTQDQSFKIRVRHK